MKKLLLLCLLLFPLTAQAGDLRVTINMAAGNEPVRYTLTAEQTHSFWSKWRQLNDSTSIVPVPPGNGYGGLTLYDADRGTEVRLYNGIGRSDRAGKADEYRQLERWVLGFAPPPLGPALVAALDEETRAQPGAVAAKPAERRSSEEVILSCRYRAGRDPRLKANCLHENLQQQLDPAEYAKALEALAASKLPARALLGARPPAAGQDGSQ